MSRVEPTHEVPTAELLVGDRIVDFRLNGCRWHVEEFPGRAERIDWVVGQLKVNNERIEVIGTDGMDIHTWVPGDQTMFRVVRGSRATATSNGRWNGTCPSCGKGTYTGFASVEHEGGGCDAG